MNHIATYSLETRPLAALGKSGNLNPKNSNGINLRKVTNQPLGSRAGNKSAAGSTRDRSDECDDIIFKLEALRSQIRAIREWGTGGRCPTDTKHPDTTSKPDTNKKYSAKRDEAQNDKSDVAQPKIKQTLNEKSSEKHHEALIAKSDVAQPQRTQTSDKKYFYGTKKTAINLKPLSKCTFKFKDESFPAKSENKSYGNVDANIPEKKLHLYSQKNRKQRSDLATNIYPIYEADDAFTSARRNNDTPAHYAHWGRLLYANRSIANVNCGDQSAVLYYMLTYTLKGQIEKNIFIDFLSLRETKNPHNGQFGHNMLVIRDLANKKSAYESKFKGCSENDWVIDPWARICCPLKDYARVWDKKMEKWQKGGKKISVGRKDRDPETLKGFIKNCSIESRFSKHKPFMDHESFIDGDDNELSAWLDKFKNIAFS